MEWVVRAGLKEESVQEFVSSELACHYQKVNSWKYMNLSKSYCFNCCWSLLLAICLMIRDIAAVHHISMKLLDDSAKKLISLVLSLRWYLLQYLFTIDSSHFTDFYATSSSISKHFLSADLRKTGSASAPYESEVIIHNAVFPSILTKASYYLEPMIDELNLGYPTANSGYVDIFRIRSSLTTRISNTAYSRWLTSIPSSIGGSFHHFVSRITFTPLQFAKNKGRIAQSCRSALVRSIDGPFRGPSL